MSSNDTETFKSWGQALAQARAQQGRDSGTLSRELMLSLAQIRGIETGDTSTFHAQSYYFRGVQRYAEHLNVQLEPPVDSLKGPDNPIAQRARTPHRAAGIAQHHRAPANAMSLPSGRTHGSQFGRWLLLLLVVLGGAGVYMAISDGWPTRFADAIQDQEHANADSPLAQGPLASAADMLEAAPLAEQALVTQIESSRTEQHSTPTPSSTTASGATTANKATPTNPLGTESKPTTPSAATPTVATAPAAPAAPTPQTPLPNSTEPAAAAQSLAQSATTTTTATDPSVVPNVSKADIVLSFHEECWVEWRLQDEQTQQRIYKPGEQLRLPVDQVQRLVLGNARSVQAQVSGAPLDMLQFIRGSGSVARIDGTTLRQSIR